MRHALTITAALVLAIGSALPASATVNRWLISATSKDSVNIPRGDSLTAPLALSSAENELFADAADGKLDRHTLLAAGLIANGVGDASESSFCRHRYEELRGDLHRSAAGCTDDADRMALIHCTLHRRLLRVYDANATDLGELFETGRYNCASATLLFVALAEELQLQATAVEFPGHVRATVKCGDRLCEVEITCPVWEQAAHWTNHDASESGTAGRREISAVGLVAMIYYNQGVDAFHSHRFAESLAANRRALLLDSLNSAARGNLLAAVNNWALKLAEEGDVNSAIGLLETGLRYDPKHLPFAHNLALLRRSPTHRLQLQPIPAASVVQPAAAAPETIAGRNDR